MSSGAGDRGESRPGDLAGRAERLYHELSDLLHDVLREKKVPATPGTEVPLRLDLELGLEVDREVQDRHAKKFGRDLSSRLQLLAEDLGAQHRPFPPGRLRCHWCEGFDCADAFPPEPRATFQGYSPTGLPVWSDFGTIALEGGHPRVQELYEGSRVPLTILRSGRELNTDQLKIYGKNSRFYRILAQLSVGYLQLRDERGQRGQLALTIQAVETRRGRPRVDLNVLGVLPDGRPAAPFLEEVVSYRLADALEAARRALGEIQLAGPLPSSEEEAGESKRTASRRRGAQLARERSRKAFRILLKLERTIDRIFRQNTRRTLHSRTRHRDRERPAATALRDALQARDDAIFRDTQEQTWVVLGPRRRVHVFSDDGRHVTSVTYPGETIRQRTARGKWRPETAGNLEKFQSTLQLLVRSTGGGDEANEAPAES